MIADQLTKTCVLVAFTSISDSFVDLISKMILTLYPLSFKSSCLVLHVHVPSDQDIMAITLACLLIVNWLAGKVLGMPGWPSPNFTDTFRGFVQI